jgi:hypothetical protein
MHATYAIFGLKLAQCAVVKDVTQILKIVGSNPAIATNDLYHKHIMVINDASRVISK